MTTEQNNVLEFPSQEVQNWVMIERGILEHIDEFYAEYVDALDSSARKRICETMKNKFDTYFSGFGISIPLPEKLTEDDRKLIIAGVQSSFVNFQSTLNELFAQDCLTLTIRLEIEKYLFKQQQDTT